MIGGNSDQAQDTAPAGVKPSGRTREPSPTFRLEIHTLACGKAYIAVLKHVRNGGGTGALRALFNAHYREFMAKAGVEPMTDE